MRKGPPFSCIFISQYYHGTSSSSMLLRCLEWELLLYVWMRACPWFLVGFSGLWPNHMLTILLVRRIPCSNHLWYEPRNGLLLTIPAPLCFHDRSWRIWMMMHKSRSTSSLDSAIKRCYSASFAIYRMSRIHVNRILSFVALNPSFYPFFFE